MQFFSALRPSPCAPGEPSPNGVLLSHREAIRETLAASAQSLLTLEADGFFKHPGHTVVTSIVNAMRGERWDAINLGCLEPSETSLSRHQLGERSGRVIGGHFCGMRRDFMERVLSSMNGVSTRDAQSADFNPTHRGGGFNLFENRYRDVRRALLLDKAHLLRDIVKNRIRQR